MGVTIVGPSGSGKSTLLKLLLHALNKMKKTISQHVFNPKAVPRTQLLGYIDSDTRQWIDGVLTICAHKVYSEPAEIWSWVVCDGDIDPEWVESLNSVLDDNRLLTLPSGWRIQFGPNVNFIFETHNLCYASPATVSRMGIVFMSEEDLNLNDLVTNWLEKQPNENVQISSYLISEYFFKAVNWIRTEGELTIPCSQVAIVHTGLVKLRNVSNKSHFAIALISGLGGLLTKSSAEIFAQKVFEWTGEHCPDENNILRCFYNKDRDLIDVHYSDANCQLDNDFINGLPLILTGQIIQTLDILRPWVSQGFEEHFLLIGPHGSAKSLILNYLVREQHNMDIATIYCSANIMPSYVLHKLSEHCIIVNSNRGRVYRPKKERLILYFKGLQLVKLDQWNTNMLIAFLHQLITYSGFFDNNLEWVGLESVTVVCSLTATDRPCSRFISLLKIHNIDLPEKDDLNIIFESYLTSVLKYILPNSTWLTKSKMSNLIGTMISVYEEVQSTFTVMQYQHYIFSPHTLTKWCTSLTRYKTLIECTDLENGLLEVICYEARRLLSDRLVNDDDKNKFEQILNKNIQLKWGKSIIINNLKDVYYVPTDSFNGSTVMLPLIRLNSEDWINMVKKGIIYFGRDGQTLDLLIIPELLSLCSMITRALTQPAGCAILAGRSGVGRRSALKIASTLQGAKLITPNSQNLTQFKLDLKMAMQSSGVEGENVYLLIEDHMIMNTDILNIVNTLLAAGEVPGLYNTAELDSLVAGLKDEADREDFVGNVYQFFNQRIRDKLHLVLCLEIDNSVFWQTLENCPVLYQKCTVIWMSEWSSETMTNVPNLLLRKLSENKIEDRVNLELPNNFYTIHHNIKTTLASPRRYMSYIDTYINLYSDKTKIIFERQSKLKAGITKLTEAKQVVVELKVQAIEQQENLAEKQSKANSALDMISATMKNANIHKQEMETLKQKTELENQQLMKRKHEIELELAEVEPILQEARSAVGNIKTEALSEIRSLRAPPDIIRDILEGVLRLMGTQDTSWNSMKTFLSKRGVKEDIRSFDASRINSDNRQAVERLLASRSESFDPKAAKRASVAAAPLASWVIANVKYSTVVEKIRPLEREQYKLQENLKLAENQIEQLSVGLIDVDAKVAELKKQLAMYTKEAAEIEINLKTAQDKLNSAEGLVGKLNEEFNRWGKQYEELSMDLKTLPVKCLLTAAFITYLSEEFEDERRLFIEKWGSTLLGENFNYKFEEFICTEREQFQWQSEGLLSDKLSIQNAAIILKSKNHVLLLDPSSLALQWLEKHLQHRNIEVITPNAPRFNTSLELAMRFGKVLIIKEVESIPTILLPIFRNEFIYQGERRLILLGNKLVDYHNDFCLYLSSRNIQLQIPADMYAVLNIINFTTTKTGLTEQLLSAAIHQEYPELQTQKSELLQKQEDLEEQQFNLQNRLLEELANATGDILQNKQLLSSLNETKVSSIAISSALENLTTVKQKLQTECDVFRPISIFGSELYFATTDLIKINVMYSISIIAFIKLFIKALSTVENAQKEVTRTQKTLFQFVYCFISRGVLKNDRLLFLLHLCHHMFPKEITKEEWKLFLGYNKETMKNDASLTLDFPQWVAPQLIQNVANFQHTLPELYKTLKMDEYKHWEQFSKARECEQHFPKFCTLTSFQQLLIVQMLRPDRLHSIMIQCVLHVTGLKNISPGNLYLSQVLKETVNYEPVLIISATGADPSSELRELALMTVGTEKYVEISMGEGQELTALKALDDASRQGYWVCLKNLHLVTTWLPDLSQKIQSLTPHDEFRLWLVTEPHSMFNSVLIQTCLKIAYEAPQGIKNNLLRSYINWDSKYIQKHSTSGARLLFVLAYVHALLQERRTYIPQGWSKLYEFTDLDLYTSSTLSEQTLSLRANSILWDHLRGLCGAAVYGGRIDNPQDTRVLLAYLDLYFNDNVLSHKWKPNTSSKVLPSGNNFQEYVGWIKELGDRDEPECFGLPKNIDRAWQKNVSGVLISALTALHVSKEKADKFSQKLLFQNLTPILTFWKKLNKNQDFLHASIPKNTHEISPLLLFINDEKIFSLQLIQNLHKSLSSISRITRGAALPNKEDMEIANSLSGYKTPSVWIKYWKGPSDPFKYLQAVMEKTIAISKFDTNTEVEEILKMPLNLSHLFHPNMFLAALKQHTSRASSIAMDDLKSLNIWSGSLKVKHSITLTGLLIEGAQFDGHILTPCSSDTETITSAPNCSFAWVPKDDLDSDENNLMVPVYYSSGRNEEIPMMYLPSNKQKNDEWLLANVALFLEY